MRLIKLPRFRLALKKREISKKRTTVKPASWHVSQEQVIINIGGTTTKFLGGPNPSIHLSPSFPFTFSSPLPFPSIPLEVGLLNRGRGLGAL